MPTIVPHVEPDAGRVADRSSAPRAVFAGLTTLDAVYLVERVPGANQKIAALDFELAAGGPAANAAVAFAACGGAPTLVTALPDHPLTAMVADDLGKHGVALTVAAGYPGPPITASILVTKSTGERAVVSPTFAATDAPPAMEALPTLDGAGLVMIDGYFRSLSLPLAAAARAGGIPVLLDAGSYKHYTDEVIAASDIAVVSDDFAPPGTDGEPDAVFGYLSDRGVTCAAITRGGGSILWRAGERDGSVDVPAATVVDTLGAGDFFHGALAYRLASLGCEPARFADDLAFAASVVARSLGSFGTRAWLR